MGGGYVFESAVEVVNAFDRKVDPGTGGSLHHRGHRGHRETGSILCDTAFFMGVRGAGVELSGLCFAAPKPSLRRTRIAKWIREPAAAFTTEDTEVTEEPVIVFVALHFSWEFEGRR